MNLPQELIPTDTIDIQLEDGVVVTLPVCHPTFALWSGEPLSFDYGKKPVLNYNNEACFAELAILRILFEHGWDGVWVETYGGVHYLQSMPQAWNLKSEHVSIPKDKDAFLKKIWRTAKTKACFDVLAWKGDRVCFFEAKRSGKDKLTSGQIKFIEGALTYGVPIDSLIIIEWNES